MSNDGSDQVRIPIIDFGNFSASNNEKENLKTIKSIAEACRDFGFFYVKNHGVSQIVQDNLLNALKEFFALPQDEKNKIQSINTGGMVGYFSLGSEITGYLVKENPDWREGIYAFGDELPDFHPSKEKFPIVSQRNILPDTPRNFKGILQDYHRELKGLGLKIMSALAQAMGLEKSFFDSKFLPYTTTTIGMFHYLPSTNQVNEISCGEHTDYGMLTILMQDDVGGLEIKGENDEWIPAPPIPGTFVVNLGDMLEVWTNGSFKANLHQVRKPKSGRDRFSVAYFFGPKLETVVSPLEIKNPLIPFKKRDINKIIKLPAVFGEYLYEKYQGTFPKHNFGQK